MSDRTRKTAAMSPATLRWAREVLNLTQGGLAEELRLSDPAGDGARMIRHYESGRRPITGPVSRVIHLLLERKGIAITC